MFVYRIALKGDMPMCYRLNCRCQAEDCMAYRERRLPHNLTLAWCARCGEPAPKDISDLCRPFIEEDKRREFLAMEICNFDGPCSKCPEELGTELCDKRKPHWRNSEDKALLADVPF